MERSRSAFSVVELLVTMGVAGTLVAMAAAGWSAALSRSKAASCLHSLRQVGMAALLYAADNDGRLPQSQHQSDSWFGSLQGYLDGTRLYRCPADPNKKRNFSYAINDFLTPNPYGEESLDYSRLTTIPSPRSTLLMAECHDKYQGSDHFHFADGDVGYAPAAFSAEVGVKRHNGAANYLFADGRVEGLTWKMVQAELQKPGSRFIRP